MSPTVFKWKGYRFFFFSREERRAHVHVSSPEGELKVWLIPEVKIALNHGLSKDQLSELIQVVKEKRDELFDAWRIHFTD